MPIRSAAVLGAGTMGAQIAAHFANAGVPALLLDLTRGRRARRPEARAALKPDPFFTPTPPALDHAPAASTTTCRALADVDWIIEAVVEQLDVKQCAARTRRRGTGGRARSSRSNTSGIPIAALAEGRSDDFRRHWLGTHFFNPPRYLHLLELIPTADTDPAVVERVTQFADHRLGKGVVVAKDTPNFIANHIGLLRRDADLPRARRAATTRSKRSTRSPGPALGRPKSATFRTMDIAGHRRPRARRAEPRRAARRAGERPRSRCRRSSQQLVERGWIGEKAGQGFYKRRRDGGSRS